MFKDNTMEVEFSGHAVTHENRRYKEQKMGNNTRENMKREKTKGK